MAVNRLWTPKSITLPAMVIRPGGRLASGRSMMRMLAPPALSVAWIVLEVMATSLTLAFAAVASTASATESKIGTPQISWPPAPGLAPATTRVVQIAEGPMPTLTPSAPASTRATAAAPVAMFPPITCISG